MRNNFNNSLKVSGILKQNSKYFLVSAYELIFSFLYILYFLGLDVTFVSNHICHDLQFSDILKKKIGFLFY